MSCMQNCLQAILMIIMRLEATKNWFNFSLTSLHFLLFTWFLVINYIHVIIPLKHCSMCVVLLIKRRFMYNFCNVIFFLLIVVYIPAWLKHILDLYYQKKPGLNEIIWWKRFLFCNTWWGVRVPGCHYVPSPCSK